MAGVQRGVRGPDPPGGDARGADPAAPPRARGRDVGYNATFVAAADTEVAILNLGYADGYLRCFSGKGRAQCGRAALPVLGRVSMDLVAIGVDAASDLAEGDWVSIDYALPETSALSACRSTN
jgi:alanine racemase